MLADQDHPLEDAIADAEAKPDPALVVVYRTRGVPWLLVPPLLLLAGVAAIVIYRRSEVVSERAAAIAWRESSSRQGAGAATSKPDTRSRFDAIEELTAATGRPASVPPVQAEGPAYDPAPPPDEPERPKPPPAVVEPARVADKAKVEKTAPTDPPQSVGAVAKPAPAEANRADPKRAPTEANRVGPKPAPTEANRSGPKPAPTEANRADLKPATTVAAPAGPTRVADPFDPLVAIPEPAKPVPVEPPAPAEPTARRDRVGFDPQATPATLEAEAEPKPEPEQPAADRPAAPTVPPAGEQPFELDRRKPGGAAARRAEQTREIEQDMQAEAERRLAEKTHLNEIKDAALNPDPAEYRRQRETFKAAVRKVAAQDARRSTRSSSG